MRGKKKPIKSPLRYPGGKSRAITTIVPLVPEYDEYREPMVGGASVFFALKQLHPNKKYWINDINRELYFFWKYCQQEPKNLAEAIRRMKRIYKGGRRGGKKLYKNLIKLSPEEMDGLDRAARFFILNRSSYSGLIESGGYSKEAYLKRFTESSIKRIYRASKILKGVIITNLDYSEVINAPSNCKTFLFLDPPYVSKTKAKLYGKKGELHTSFNHEAFAANVKKCAHKFLITDDKCNKVEELYKFANTIGLELKEWTLQYGTNNGPEERETKSARIGKEFFISNYKTKEPTKVYILATNSIKQGK